MSIADDPTSEPDQGRADASGQNETRERRSKRRPGNRLREVSIEFEVPFHDVDALRIVWHGHYFKYFELARTALMRSCKLDVPEVVDLGHRMLVIESHSRHTSPLAYGDRARVTAWLADVLHRIHVRYEIQNLTQGRRAAYGHTMLVATTRDGKMLHRTPEAMLAQLLGGEASLDGHRDVGERCQR